jgi:hypothetical protein
MEVSYTPTINEPSPVSSVTRTAKDGIVLPYLFTELPLTPKMNGHQQPL